jgi:hypothetical protein
LRPLLSISYKTRGDLRLLRGLLEAKLSDNDASMLPIQLDPLAAEVTLRLGEDAQQNSCHLLVLGRTHLDEKARYPTANSWTANVRKQTEQIV